MTYDAAEVVVDTAYTPKVTLTRDTSGTLTAVVEVEGLAPVRTPNAEESSEGIDSLDPPTVSVSDSGERATVLLRLIDSSQRALFAAYASTLGATPEPDALSMIAMRLSIALRRALREMDEDA